MYFKVNRSKWRTGGDGENMTGRGQTRLLNTQGYMCCLGFCMLDEGFTEEQILDMSAPNIVCLESGKRSNLMEHREAIRLSDYAISINDAVGSTQKQKEVALVELFKEYGHTIEFYDGEPAC